MEAAGRGGRKADWRQVKNRKTGGSPEECPVCLNCFDGAVQRPRTLPCGHTVCTLCIDNLKKQGRVTCPECRVIHAVPKGGQFPVCYTVEALIRMLREAEVAPAGADDKKDAAGLSKKMRSFLQEQEKKVEAAIAACQETQCQLDQYQTTLTGWGEQQQQLEDSLLRLVDQSRSARELVQQEKSLAAAKEEEVKKRKQGLKAVLVTLRTLTTEQEAGAAVAKMIHCIGDAEQVLEKCRECFPDASTVTTLRKVREAPSYTVEAARALQTGLETLHIITTEGLRSKFVPGSTIRGRAERLQARDLLCLTQPAKRLVEAGLVFVVHQSEGRRRHARISLNAGKLYLHVLRDLPLPLGAATLQVREIVPPSPPCTVFLDLSWPGSAPRRVRIRLVPNIPLGRQFLLLCTGQRGPSYVNTRMKQVVNKGMEGEYVEGGDFKSNDGHWGSALLPGLNNNKYQDLGWEGTVFGLRWNDPTKGECGRFGISTRNQQAGALWYYAFGRVVDGLHVVAEAAQYRDITKVAVVDCGVVL